MKVFVLAETLDSLKELCSGAHRLGDRVEAIFVGTDAGQGKEITTAEKVWFIPIQNMYEDCVGAVASLIQEEKPELVIIEPTVRLKLVAGRIAAKLDTSVIANVVEAKDGSFERMVYGGAGVAKVKAAAGVTIVTAGPGMLEPTDESYDPEVVSVQASEPSAKINVVKRTEVQKSSVDLGKSNRVIGVGRGIQKEEDLAMIREFADAINAEVGCTRPISEGEKWMPKETYIGVSGLTLSPDIYISLGISGQIQHVIGVNRSKVFIAVNKDPNAMIFDAADYGIVGDLYKVVPALTKALQ